MSETMTTTEATVTLQRTDLDLANRALGGSVRGVSDDLFAPVEALLLPGRPVHDPSTFGPRGKIYDGWESRRRRAPGHDWAVVALGIPGVVHEVVVDTAYFRGNYPPEVTVEAARLEQDVDPVDPAVVWTVIVPRSPCAGDTENRYAVDDPGTWTHVRLLIHPDGGVARLRVLGTAVPDPRLLGGRIDLAALRHGGDITQCSDMFYSDARNVLMPGEARTMGEGWENQRRRGDGNDYLVVSFAGPARLAWLDLDTSYFVGNAPGEVQVSARTETGDWVEVLARTRVRIDLHNRFRLPRLVADAVRVDVFPDGGMARLHVYGELLPTTLSTLLGRWYSGEGDSDVGIDSARDEEVW